MRSRADHSRDAAEGNESRDAAEGNEDMSAHEDRKRAEIINSQFTHTPSTRTH